MPCRLHFSRDVTLLRKVSRNEFLGDVPSRFPRPFGVTEPFHVEHQCVVRCHAMSEESVDNVCLSFGVFVDVITGRCECFRWWRISGQRCVRIAVCVDSFHILVPLNQDYSHIFLNISNIKLFFGNNWNGPSAGLSNLPVFDIP